jgi:hypothetical protein
VSLFNLDPVSIAARVHASSRPPRIPTFAQSILRGAVGFMIVSIAGFLPWVFAGKWHYRNPSELVMYLTCAAVFISLSGLLLHPLIIGPGSLKRFYIFFSIAFAAYAFAWIAGWMGLRGHAMHVRSIVGLLAGTVVMGILFSLAFAAPAEMLKVIAVLFLLNSLGYFVGGWVEGCLARQNEISLIGVTLTGRVIAILMKLLWGACFGIGLGAGLGIAFHLCQRRARALLHDAGIRM